MDHSDTEGYFLYPPGHTVLFYPDDEQLIRDLPTMIDINLARDGQSLLFLSGPAAVEIKRIFDKKYGKTSKNNDLKFFLPEDFNSSTFRRLMRELSSGSGREILVLRELPREASSNEILKDSRTISQLLQAMPVRIVCLANESVFEPKSLLAALSSHPWVIIQGMLIDNFYFTDGAFQKNDSQSILHYRMDTLQLQGLLRKEVIGKLEASSKEMQKRIQELSILNSVATAATKTFDIHTLAKEVLPVLAKFLEMDASEIVLPDEKGNTMNFKWAASQSGRKALEGFDVLGNLVSECIASDKPFWSIDIDNDDINVFFNEQNTEVTSYLIMPVNLMNGAKGVLKFISLTHVDLPAEKIELVKAASSEIVIGIENSRLYNENLAAKREWEETFNSLSDMILIRDTNFRTLRYNQKMALGFEMNSGKGIGRECYKIIFNRDTPCPQCLSPRENQEWRVKEEFSREGKIFSHGVFQLMNEEGKAIGAIHVMNDITEEERLRQQLYRADKMTSMGTMIAGVAHEVNNPLTGILGFTEILLEQDLTKEQRDFTEKIYREANRAAQVMHGLLLFARDYSPRRESVDINAILLDCLNIRSHDLQMKNIRIQYELDDIPPTTADPNQLRQVFINLINNAEHAVLDLDDPGIILISVKRKGIYIEIKICDNGPGIPPDKLTKVFDPFYTTKEPGKGTGLGLAVSQAIIMEHKGTIEIEQSPLGGAAFIIKLPIISPVLKSALTEQKFDSKPALEARILVVDDEPSLRRIVELTMKKEGHKVKTASNAFDAIKILNKEAFDLIILDMKMPGMGGIEFCRHISEPLPSILIMSGDTVSDEIQAFTKETGADFIPKPFNLIELKEAVRNKLKILKGK